MPHLWLKGVCNESISPDGASLAFTAEESLHKLNGLWVARLKDGTRRYLRGMDNDSLLSSAWSPDSRWVAYVHSRMTTQGFTSSSKFNP